MFGPADQQKAAAVLVRIDQVARWVTPTDPVRVGLLAEVQTLLARTEPITRRAVADLEQDICRLRASPFKTLLHRQVMELHGIRGWVEDPAAPLDDR